MPDYFVNGRDSARTVLSERISLAGDLSFEDSLEIRGSFSGTIRSKGLLIIGSSAEIRGDIYSKDLIVEGKVRGNLLVFNRLSVESNAEIIGDIATHKIKVVNNAVLDGDCFTLEEKELLERFQKAAPEMFFRPHYPEASSSDIPRLESREEGKEEDTSSLLSPTENRKSKKIKKK